MVDDRQRAYTSVTGSKEAIRATVPNEPVVDQVFVMEVGDSNRPTEHDSQYAGEEEDEKLKALYERYLMRELKGEFALSCLRI